MRALLLAVVLSWVPGPAQAAPSLLEAPGGPVGHPAFSGELSWAAPSLGRFYLAIREPRGTRVRICGPAACLIRRSTDFGPVASLVRRGRIADVSAWDFEVLCGVSPEERMLIGLCPGTVTIEGPEELPATDTEGMESTWTNPDQP